MGKNSEDPTPELFFNTSQNNLFCPSIIYCHKCVCQKDCTCACICMLYIRVCAWVYLRECKWMCVCTCSCKCVCIPPCLPWAAWRSSKLAQKIVCIFFRLFPKQSRMQHDDSWRALALEDEEDLVLDLRAFKNWKDALRIRLVCNVWKKGRINFSSFVTHLMLRTFMPLPTQEKLNDTWKTILHIFIKSV